MCTSFSLAAYTINIMEIPLEVPSGNIRTISIIFNPKLLVSQFSQSYFIETFYLINYSPN